MAVYSVLHPFDNNEQNWKSYSQRAKSYFTANSIIDEDKQRAITLDVLRPKIFKMVKNTRPKHCLSWPAWKLVTTTQADSNSAEMPFYLTHLAARPVAELVAALNKLLEYCGFTRRCPVKKRCYETSWSAESTMNDSRKGWSRKMQQTTKKYRI